MNFFTSPPYDTMNSPSTIVQNGQEEPKPKPSLSSYNLFFKVERKRILEGTDQAGLPMTIEELRQTIQEHKKQGKRQHRKTHGKIGFRELARAIASRWKKLDAATKQLLEDQARVEKEAYLAELEAWKARNPQMAREEEMASGTKQGSKSKNNKKMQEGSTHVSTEQMKMLYSVDSTQCSIDKIQALMKVRAKIQAEMHALSERSRNDLYAVQSLPIQQEQRPMPAFYSPVDTQETFSSNFFDQEEEEQQHVVDNTKDSCFDNVYAQEQASLMAMFNPSYPNATDTNAEAADFFQPFPADIQSEDFFEL